MRTNTKQSRKAQGRATPVAGAVPEVVTSLTAEQKNFAKVVGQALAEAWRRKWQQGAALAGTLRRQARDS